MQLLYILKHDCFTLFPKTMGTCLSNRYLSTIAPSVTYSIIWTISRSFTYFPHSRSLLSTLAFSLAPVQKEACVTDPHIPLAASYLQQHFLRQSSQILGCGVIWWENQPFNTKKFSSPILQLFEGFYLQDVSMFRNATLRLADTIHRG